MKKETIHYAPEYFISPQHPVSIALIGAGGTGSLVAPRLARLDYVLKELGLPGLYVIVYDGDTVEQNNVGRQNFSKNDIGDYKAANIVQKINMAYGLDWECKNEYVGDKIPDANIVISCVDNVELRNKIHKKREEKSIINRIDYTTPFYWLDCGNGKDFGQVILSTIFDIHQPEKSVFKCQKRLPSVIDIYGELSQYDTKESQGIEGCSMAESLSKQDVFINDEIAIQAVKIVQQLVRNYRISYHGAVVNQATSKVIGIPIP
jgi:PRTRC genetic system ThiF family protein